ncbi:MAG: hypothetical protein O4859_06070 [Trichodesmium sp. St18_bin1]|nr:hypothetical protein [Trichodesmium sp. St18_bin1]
MFVAHWFLVFRLSLTPGSYSAFQIDELHRHNQNLVGTFHATSLLWSTKIKTAIRLIEIHPDAPLRESAGLLPTFR